MVFSRELVSRLDDDIGGARDQVVGLQQPIDRRLRTKYLSWSVKRTASSRADSSGASSARPGGAAAPVGDAVPDAAGRERRSSRASGPPCSIAVVPAVEGRLAGSRSSRVRRPADGPFDQPDDLELLGGGYLIPRRPHPRSCFYGMARLSPPARRKADRIIGGWRLKCRLRFSASISSRTAAAWWVLDGTGHVVLRRPHASRRRS